MKTATDELQHLTKHELFDLAMVLYNIQYLRTKHPQKKVLNVAADLHNFQNEYFLANYTGHTYYDEEDDEMVAYEHTDLRNQEIEALRRLVNNGALKGVTTRHRKTEDPAGLGIEYEESHYYQLVLDGDKFGAYYQQVIEAAQARILMSASLSFEGMSTPTVIVNNNTYKLASMRVGNAFNIVSHCLEKSPDKEVSLVHLKETLALSGVLNINEALKNSLFDSKRGLLRCFADSSPKTIVLHKTVQLPKPQLEKIILASKK